MKKFKTINHEVDFCVVGGGMAGLCAALAAARHGAKTLLMQDRPVLGGNASSEIRMWICGAHGADNKETGILEEILLDNTYRNPTLKYPIWDSMLYALAQAEPNLTMLLNCSCCDVRCEGSRITFIRGWQTTSQTWQRVSAKYFADCSGDSVLRISGAEYRWGRESRGEFNESHAPQQADRKTMGNSILIQLREVEEHVPFNPPPWAHHYTEADLPNRGLNPEGNNFWWLEIGGTQNTIADTEVIHDELLKIAYGVWALIKNHPDGRGRRWELEWIGALPGKRESVRYVGEHILTQNDIEAGGRFADRVAYGGWSMDDHHPEAIRYPGPPTIFHPAPSPYGIPYRCLYSRNIDNLFFAGRNISTTHMALSSTRVMGTCAILGQAVGTAAALALQHSTSPQGVYQNYIRELQERLMDDDCYLPWFSRSIPQVTRSAHLTATCSDPEDLRSGVDRSLGGADNGWWGGTSGDWVEYRFDTPLHLSRARLVFDSDLGNTKRMPESYPARGHHAKMPEMLTRNFDLEVLNEQGEWKIYRQGRDNIQRLVKIPLNVVTEGIRFVPRTSWGGERVHVFAFDVR
jgi:hypothetical protein